MTKPQKTRENNILTRALPFEQKAVIDTESRTIRVSFSSETEYLRQPIFSEPWVEVLGHKEGESDFSRLNHGAPVLYNHHRSDANYKVIGVVERAWLENGRGMAELRLSRRADIDSIWQDVQDGILRNVSVAYTIDERTLTEEKKDSPSIYRVTRWTPMEISLVDIPADPTVGVGRAAENLNPVQPNLKEELPMTKETVIEHTRTETPPDMEQIREQARKEALAAEQTRRSAIREAFKEFGEDHLSLLEQCLENQETTPDQARSLLLKELGRNRQPLAAQNISVGEGEREKFTRYAEEAIAVRAGLDEPAEGGNYFRGYTLLNWQGNRWKFTVSVPDVWKSWKSSDVPSRIPPAIFQGCWPIMPTRPC